ncbi:MAG TPA: hypothetical protein VM536_15645 [Chloroflexia bacterium]|nr:hypothetical protein [Chloroflexia bacterium]
MAITTITRVENRASAPVTLLDIENPSAPGHGLSIPPGGVQAVQLPVPWAGDAGAFPTHRLEVQVGGQTRFWIWQAARGDGDFVRFSTDGAWHDPGFRAHGIPLVEGTRTLIAQDGCFLLVSFPDDLLAALGQAAGSAPYALCAAQPPDPRPHPPTSVPKGSAVAFSMAGPPSDAFARGEPGAPLLYRDSGKRYEFRVINGAVQASGPDGLAIPLTAAVSFSRRRAGEAIPLPPIDLIAANGGRVFAKAQGQDAFFFATMDRMFVARDEQGRLYEVPSTYFKLDPEFHQPGARVVDLLAPLRGCFGDHPAAERFPLFRAALEQNLTDMMLVALQPRVWNLLDLRPPVGGIKGESQIVGIMIKVLEQVRPALIALQLAMPWAPFLDQLNAYLARAQAEAAADQADLDSPTPTVLTPPAWVPSDPVVAYCEGTRTTTLKSVHYTKVLDIGVGHVHWHEQYESITGGEMQPMRAPALFPTVLPQVHYAYLYRIVNGPLRDADGYIDGTCNFYALVQLRDDAALGVGDSYALLYCDEQTYFTHRWRVVHPDDWRGMMFALAKGLHDDPTGQPPLYDWHPETYWCPFRAGRIGPRSRLAASRQVLIVNGVTAGGQPVLYSINFSYATMDRTWRWRALPPGATPIAFADDAAAGAEQVPNPGTSTVFPETVRLRDDLTLHLKGTRQSGPGTAEVGRWYQRYLPANNVAVPPPAELVAGAPPPRGYTHPWKFLPEAVFQAADRFSHFGVYDTVDSRTQYYTVTPASSADAATLAAAGPGPWVDVNNQLYVRAWKFWWTAPLRGLDSAPLGDLDAFAHHEGRPRKHPPSMYNPDTRLRVAVRGGRLIALHWDKRDDDLMPFDGLPLQVVLQNGTARATVTITGNTWVESPPVVPWAAFVWPATPGDPVTVRVGNSTAVWRVRMAALDASRPGGVVWLLDTEMAGRFAGAAGGGNQYSWTPGAQTADLQRYAGSATAARQYGTSLWCEDVAGHVSVPEAMRWLRTMRVTLTPAQIPYGVEVPVTVQAVDAQTGTPLAGDVVINGRMVGRTGTSFRYTFTPQMTRVFDPELRVWTTVPVDPQGTVVVPDYDDGAIPFSFYVPGLRTQVQPAAIPAGPPVQVTVQAFDTTTGVPVAGRVLIGGQDAGATGTPFTRAFAPGANGTVTAAGYPNAGVSFPVYTPALRLTVTPTSLVIGRPTAVTVQAVDTTTGGAVAGRVLINGQDVGATNTAFTYAFPAPVPPGVVRATYYADTPIAWPVPHAAQLRVAVQLYPLPVGTAVSVRFTATDVDSGAAVDGAVKVNGTEAGRTNTTFTYTFRMTRVRRFDPELRIYIYVPEPPTVVVSAAGYPDQTVDTGIAG